MPDMREPPPIGYLIPEFPGQTHTWIWREVCHMREAGARIQVFSTRRPPDRDRARHSFADNAAEQTTYLHPAGAARLARALLAVGLRHPIGLCRAVRTALALPVEAKPNLRTVLPLLAPALCLADDAKRLGLQHLHVHACSNSAVIAMLAKDLSGMPFSLTLNANIDWWGGAMAEKFSAARFTIAITDWLEKQVRDRFPQLRDDQVQLGRIGVDTLKWRPKESSPPSTAEDRPLQLISFGRLHPSKGYTTLLRALDLFAKRPDAVPVHLTLIGDGPQRAELEALTNELGLAPHVTFAGSQSEDFIIDQLNDADVFVLSSKAEPLGVVTMEAMAMGVAVIATDAGGVREIVTDGQDGLLVPPEDAAALAEALADLATHPERREQLAHAGRDSIVQRFDSRYGAATLYQRLFGERPTHLLQALADTPPDASASPADHPPSAPAEAVQA
ncbi:MAG: glycosyltransferase family 4 protein [Planctomycetota bacterium]